MNTYERTFRSNHQGCSTFGHWIWFFVTRHQVKQRLAPQHEGVGTNGYQDNPQVKETQASSLHNPSSKEDVVSRSLFSSNRRCVLNKWRLVSVLSNKEIIVQWWKFHVACNMPFFNDKTHVMHAFYLEFHNILEGTLTHRALMLGGIPSCYHNTRTWKNLSLVGASSFRREENCSSTKTLYKKFGWRGLASSNQRFVTWCYVFYIGVSSMYIVMALVGNCSCKGKFGCTKILT